jgi:DMSO/TMAO reductase YedYZ molybdopterin-dependent catalytic subunit
VAEVFSMVKRIIASVIVLAVVAAGVVFAVNKAGFVSTSATGELPSVEIREYEGKRLSSVNDFRENSIKGPQHVDITGYQLKVTGLVETPVEFAYDDVINDFQHYQKMVRLDCVEGWSVNILWEGMLVRDLIDTAGALPEAKTIIFHAYDGYTTSFPVDYIMGNDIIMAYRMNEITMPPERGFPFQLVAESKWGYKWIKWITEIEVSDDEFYRGYWENRGYSNSGDLDKTFFERLL